MTHNAYMKMCKYTTKECTLFYMPHCGIAMYNNLLWANWDPSILSKIAIVGNRFSSSNERYIKYNMTVLGVGGVNLFYRFFFLPGYRKDSLEVLSTCTGYPN